MTNKDLRKLYLTLNKMYFQNSLDKDIEIKFVENLEDEGTKLSGMCEGGDIYIEAAIGRLGGDFVQIVLLHEMAHAFVPDNGHGMIFQGVIVDLFKKGAYDGLLILPFVMLFWTIIRC